MGSVDVCWPHVLDSQVQESEVVMTICMYGAVAKGQSDPVIFTDDVNEARVVAQDLRLQLIEYVFTLDDSELVEDYSRK